MSEAIPLRVAVVRSSWHAEIVDRSLVGIREVVGDDVDLRLFRVPGAFEIPLFTRSLVETGRFDAIIAAGLVVDGGIYRHEFVADAVIGGLMRVQLDTGIPVFSCVLTPHRFHDHGVHEDFFADHMVAKGREVAEAALATLSAHRALLVA